MHGEKTKDHVSHLADEVIKGYDRLDLEVILPRISRQVTAMQIQSMLTMRLKQQK